MRTLLFPFMRTFLSAYVQGREISQERGHEKTEDKGMGRKFVFILKILVGAYLIFVGVTLLRTISDVRPSNFQVMGVTSAIFILVGTGYIIYLFGSILKRKVNASVQYREEPGMSMTERPVRDESLFRTAPMAILKEEKQDTMSERRPYEERKTDEKPLDRSLKQSSPIVQLHTVGPDTTVWKNDHIK